MSSEYLKNYQNLFKEARVLVYPEGYSEDYLFKEAAKIPYRFYRGGGSLKKGIPRGTGPSVIKKKVRASEVPKTTTKDSQSNRPVTKGPKVSERLRGFSNRLKDRMSRGPFKKSAPDFSGKATPGVSPKSSPKVSSTTPSENLVSPKSILEDEISQRVPPKSSSMGGMSKALMVGGGASALAGGSLYANHQKNNIESSALNKGRLQGAALGAGAALAAPSVLRDVSSLKGLVPGQQGNSSDFQYI